LDEMNNKKAEEDAWSLMKGIIVGLMLVGILAFIVFRSIGISTTSIFEPLKKMLGFENKAEKTKAEASTSAQDCTIRKEGYYWQPKRVRFGEQVSIVIEGSGNCDGKNVRLIVYGRFFNKRSSTPWEDIIIEGNIDIPFKDKIIKREFTLENAPDPLTMVSAYFTLEFGNYKARSDNLEIVK